MFHIFIYFLVLFFWVDLDVGNQPLGTKGNISASNYCWKFHRKAMVRFRGLPGQGLDLDPVQLSITMLLPAKPLHQLLPWNKNLMMVIASVLIRPISRTEHRMTGPILRSKHLACPYLSSFLLRGRYLDMCWNMPVDNWRHFFVSILHLSSR